MRPLRLEVKGFTAFRDPVEIDFTPLDVFAIAGPTGSGKSSLLDAMTYALYGRVERVGDRVSQLISQGQPRMAVTLEFEVGRHRYRVTRSTPARGSTKIQLERQVEGQWRQAGEGSDRVRDADQLIARAIGLTYDGFTRSVLLPQGRFAEFLAGEAKTRREILVELLGLTLFRRMAERAGAMARDASVRARTMTDVLEREYADATPKALKEARAAVRAADRREELLGLAAERVVQILSRVEESRRAVQDLRACLDDAAGARDVAGQAARDLAGLSGLLLEATAAAERRTDEATAADRAADAASSALRDGVASGSPEELAAVQAQAHALAEVVRARAARAALLEASTQAAGALAAAVGSADEAVARRYDVLAKRESTLSAADAALEEARHADLVAAVSLGLEVGDPCPVCGLPLEKPPTRVSASSTARALERATTAQARARGAVEEARGDLARAERVVDASRRELEANAAVQARLGAEIDEFDDSIAGHRAALGAVLGDPLPPDPVSVLQDRLAAVQQLDRLERDAARAAAEASRALLMAAQERDRLLGLVARHRDRLAIDHRPLLARVGRAIGAAGWSVDPPDPPSGDGLEEVRRFADRVSAYLDQLVDELDARIEEHAGVEARMLREAVESVAGMIEPAGTIEAVAGAVDAACRRATADAATAAQRAGDLAERLKRKKMLAAESGKLEGRTRLFKALAQELRADRLIAFLEAEALQVLAAAASDRLAGLSQGRYRLACRDDEFFVVDTWNGDEERSVRTLSGGETFLASLALALALADQVRSLSVVDRAALDSLFLDEGFGTLDQEALVVVVDAIEQLAGDGRLVGIITHVRELAEQFPRLEVEKSQRGSRLTLVR